MPEADLMLYRVYASHRMLPTRRMELHLATLTRVLAQVNGNPDVLTTDFLFDTRKNTDAAPEATAEEAQAAFGFKPIGSA